MGRAGGAWGGKAQCPAGKGPEVVGKSTKAWLKKRKSVVPDGERNNAATKEGSSRGQGGEYARPRRGDDAAKAGGTTEKGT